MDINSPAGIGGLNNIKISNESSGDSSGGGFGDLLQNTISDTSGTLKTVESLGSASLVDSVSLEELGAAVANAEMTLKTVVAVRDKVIAAYQDIIKMPI